MTRRMSSQMPVPKMRGAKSQPKLNGAWGVAMRSGKYSAVVPVNLSARRMRRRHGGLGRRGRAPAPQMRAASVCGPAALTHGERTTACRANMPVCVVSSRLSSQTAHRSSMPSASSTTCSSLRQPPGNCTSYHQSTASTQSPAAMPSGVSTGGTRPAAARSARTAAGTRAGCHVRTVRRSSVGRALKGCRGAGPMRQASVERSRVCRAMRRS